MVLAKAGKTIKGELFMWARGNEVRNIVSAGPIPKALRPEREIRWLNPNRSNPGCR